ncbi:MAG: hypothetical protein KGM96_11970 [Acidobacteriota bacterium]|nr:hypothetical protein [Acidobacteriota bacterium]
MTKQTKSCKSLGGSRAGISLYRLCTLTLVAALAAGAAVLGFAQDQPEAAKPAKKAVETKPASESTRKTVGNYQVHQSVELGGRITQRDGSKAMWATMVNQNTGMRVLNHSLEMHSLDPSKTPFFDTLSSASFGYGGDPYDVSFLKVSKGRWYDFSGTFRRDRNYFDYNLLANSLLANPFVPETSTPHLFNTVRRNTDTMLTLMPLSRVNFRAGFNHGTHEGPTYSTVHEGADAQMLYWFRNAADTYTGGVDVKLAKRTTLSYDQFYVLYKGDNWQQLVGANYPLSNGQKVSFGIDNLATNTCTLNNVNTGPLIINGLANPNCSGITALSVTAPTRTTFPTEQLRFSSRYWERVSMNGRFTYNGGISNVNSFNETYTGLTTRTYTRQEIDTGGLGNGRLAHNKRVNVNADYGVEAELSKYVSVSDAFNYWAFRIPGYNSVVSTVWAGTKSNQPNLLTPLSSLTPATKTTVNNDNLSQKFMGNTLMGIFTITPEFKLSAGWRYNNRHLQQPDDLAWRENWMLLGAVIQPTNMVRINVNYDAMDSKNANSETTTNTYMRLQPNRLYHLRGRVKVTPYKWINFAATGNTFGAQNNDPLVNHHERNNDFSLATQIIPSDTFSMDLNYAHDDVFSSTDICYLYTPTTALPGGGNNGTCSALLYPPTPSGPDPRNNANYLLGTGYYDTPTTFFSGAVHFAPSTKFQFNGGAMVNSVNGKAEQLNPQMVPGSLNSRVVSPFADLVVKVAPQWSWHGNWMHRGYSESSLPGPAGRNFNGEIVTLGVIYAF